MIYRALKNDERIKPSLLGFGFMRLPLVPGSETEVDEAHVTRLVDTAMAQGINYFDTAYPYHDGQSEAILGRTLTARFPRDSFYLTTKLPSWAVTSTEDAERIFNEQLARCQVDYFDFYFLHSLDRDRYASVEAINIYDWMLEKKAQGKIRHIGFSFHDDAETLRTIVNDHPWDVVQIQLNYLDWTFQDAAEKYRILEEKGIPCMVMEPVRGGQLHTLTPDATAILRQADPKASNASWAIRYVAGLSNVLCVLSGMNDEAMILDNVQSVTAPPLSDSERATLEKAREVYMSAHVIPCSGCRYCMPCPAGVNIPLNFTAYNQYRVGNNIYAFMPAYRLIEEGERASACVECCQCMEQCPQHIQIPEEMRRIVQTAEENADL